MKRGTPNHPKTLALAAALDLERWGAVGILECLWHFAGQYARRGDLGRHENAAIAAGVGWSRDPDELISALVRCGWLDACSCHRLRIHDWHEHADQAVQKTLDVKRQGFIECYETDGGRISVGYPKDSGGKPSADSRHRTHGTGLTAQDSRQASGARKRSGRRPKPADDVPEAHQGCDDVAEILERRADHSATMLAAFARLHRDGRTREQWRAVLLAYRDRSTSTAAFARDGTEARPGRGPGLAYLLRPGEKGGFDRVWLQLQERGPSGGGARASPLPLDSGRSLGARNMRVAERYMERHGIVGGGDESEQPDVEGGATEGPGPPGRGDED